MITPPPSWSRTSGEHVLVLRPPRGGGRVRFYAQLAPKPFHRIVAEVLALDPGFVAAQRSAIQRAVTLEGEYGASLELAGTQAGRPARRWIAAVFVDSFVAALDGLSLSPESDAEIAEQTRAMFEHASFGATLRRRRYVYAPPPGWQALPGGLIATWYPPGYPRHRAQIVVYPAEPSPAAAPEVFRELIEDEERRGFLRSGDVLVLPFPSPLMTGHHFSFQGAWSDERQLTHRHAVVLSDSRFYYVARLETTSAKTVDADAAALRELGRSIEPLPHRGEGALASDVGRLADLSIPWAE